MKSVRIGLILAWVGVLLLILTACSPIVELPLEEPGSVSPVDQLAENLQLSEEQLQKLEEGTGTMQLREEQVDIVRDPIEQLLNDIKQLLSETRWQEVKDVLDTVLTEHEADLQQLGRAVEDIYDSLNAQAEAGVYTNFEKLSGSYSSPRLLSELSEGSKYSTIYTPKYSEEGQEDFNTSSAWGGEYGAGGKSIPSANEWSGAVGVYTDSMGFGAAQATALQQIRIEVPADNSDVEIKATIRYRSGTCNYAPPAAIAGASITKRDFNGNLTYDVIDPLFGWEDAIETALTIIPIPVDDIAEAIDLLGTIHDLDEVASFNEALKAEGTKETITYSANAVSKGVYAFGIGFRTETSAALSVATAFVFGQVPKITVTVTSPTTQLPTATINSPSDGSAFTKGEPIKFKGAATDPEDGPLTGNSLVWTSDIDGQIGTGESFSKSDLSVGTHTITLTATDSDGNTGEASITISVGKQPSPDLTVTSVTAPSSAGVGDTISVTFTVENNGGSISKEFKNRVFLSTTQYGGDGQQIPIDDFPMTLNGTVSKTETVDVTISQVPEGDWYMAVYTDCDEIIDEANEGNNINSAEITINGAQKASFQIAEFDVPSSAKVGTSVTIHYAVKNTGGEEGTRTITLTIEDSTGNIVHQVSQDKTISSGAIFSEDIQHTFANADEYTVILNTQDDQKSGTIQVSSNKSPTATITSPSDSPTFTKGEPIKFQGEATDPEDGPLTGNSLVWSSDIDGQIGTGESFTRDDLSVGTHTITLTATDSQGATGTDSIIVTVEEVKKILYVDDDLKDYPDADYTKIQEAVDAASAGYTIKVYPGTYNEMIDVGKQLNLKGIGEPIVNAKGKGIPITIDADNCVLDGFYATGFGGEYGGAGIYVASNDNTITNNKANSNHWGIYVDSNDNTISGNTANSNYTEGIFLTDYATHNAIYNNTTNSNGSDGIELRNGSNRNALYKNTANYNNSYGLALLGSSDNEMYTNILSDNGGAAIDLVSSNDNQIYLNDLLNKDATYGNVHSINSANKWQSPKKITYTYQGSSYTNYLGNYYNDYNEPDTDGDGIGDSPYVIDSETGESDNYPLIEPLENYNISD